MIEVRKAEMKDWEDIVRLAAQHKFPFPDFRNMLSAVVVVKDGKVIAFAYVKALVEAVFIPDLSSKKNIVSSLRLIYNELLGKVKEMNVEQVHLFTDNHEFADILKAHFNFEDANGEALVLEVANG